MSLIIFRIQSKEGSKSATLINFSGFLPIPRIVLRFYSTLPAEFRIDLLNEALKDIAPKYSAIWNDEKKRKDIELFTTFIKKLNPVLAERITSFYIILNKIAQENLTPEDLHKYIKKPELKKSTP